MLPRRYFMVYAFAGGGVFVFLLIMFASFMELGRIGQRLSDNSGESMLWMTSQAAREATRLALALERAEHGAVSKDDLALRLDIAESRLRVIAIDPLLSFYHAMGRADGLQRLHTKFQAVKSSLEAHMRADAPTDLAALGRDIEKIANDLSSYANFAMIAEREGIGAQYDAQRAATERLLYASLAAMIAGGFLGLWLLRSLQRQRRISVELDGHRAGLEAIVAERTSALNEALSTERQAKEVYRSFITTVSHQFRTPLAVIQMISQRLSLRAPQFSPEDIAKKAATITLSSRKLSELLASVTRVAALDRITILKSVDKIDLAQLWRELALQFELRGYQREVHFDIAPDLPAISGDRALLEQVAENLLNNAIKYSSAPSPIFIRLWQAGDQLFCAVTDQGIGIPESDHALVFERFHRCANAANIFGSGLGLNLSQTIINLHRGTLTFVSELGRGSTFTFSLPLELDHAEG